MSLLYCSQCGKKHEYNFAKPNFCSACGYSLGVVLASKQPATTKSIAKSSRKEEVDEDFDDEDFSDSDELPQIDKLEFDVENFSDYNSFSLNSIFGGEQSVQKSTRKRSVSLEDFKNNKK